MAKIYDNQIDISVENNSHSYILRQIKPGSRVLECGCATGYMTRYMKEVLNAQVWIVEFNGEAFKKAKEYAVDGICANLEETESWMTHFAGLEFDYIIFADVLEHLRNPEEVLKNAVSLLGEDGKVVVSLPNVAHTDILLKLHQNQWNYTPMGLLDDTHIHFWAYGNLSDLFSNAELSPVVLDYTISPPFRTEQGNLPINELSPQFVSTVCSRPYSDVYQFIVTAMRSDYVLKNKIVCENRYELRHSTYSNSAEIELFKDGFELRMQELQNAYDNISNSTIWRATKPVRAVLDFLKQLFG